MKIAIITVAYGLADDLLRLFESANQQNVMWHLFLHSQYPDVVKACHQLSRYHNVILYDYGVNRGLAKSWNEGLIEACRQSADVALIANDDAIAGDGDVDLLAEAACLNRDRYMVSGLGTDQSTGERKDMLFSLAAVNPIALETIGYFDQNFAPIYFEDIDWYYRAKLAGLERLCIPQTNIIHAGSKSRHLVDETQFMANFVANCAYYGAKWGCADQGSETYMLPFNDSRFDLKISADQRHASYPDYNRTEQERVSI